MKEPILFNDRVNRETYRLMWLRSFNDPVVVRIEKNNEDYMLYWKIRCDSCENNRLTLNNSRIISKREWNSFKWQLQKTFYWRMWSKIPSLAIGLDGSEWILEGSNKNNYHVVDRWSPDNTSYRKCCTYLLQMTDIKNIK